MGDYSPASLPPITSIEVVVLEGVNSNRVDEYMSNAVEAHSITLQGADAQRIAELWRSLPPGEQARCHLPPFGLRFRSEERVVCEASICWECDNIFGNAEGLRIHYQFDASHPTSLKLLDELRRAVGGPTSRGLHHDA